MNNLAYKKTNHRKLHKIEKLQLAEQEKLALYLFSQKKEKLKKPLPVTKLYFMDQTPQQVRSVESLGASL
jgi:hypothetical protein